MNRLLGRGLVLLVVLVTCWSIGGLVPPASAASARCAIIQSADVAGVDWRPLHASRVCSPLSDHGVSGVTYVGQGQIVVTYNEESSSLRQVSKTTAHELTHLLEYRATPEQRQQLYGYLGVHTSGSYEEIPTARGENLPEWKANPRERLAESVVSCQFGVNSFPGMELVPAEDCEDFIGYVQQVLDEMGPTAAN